MWKYYIIHHPLTLKDDRKFVIIFTMCYRICYICVRCYSSDHYNDIVIDPAFAVDIYVTYYMRKCTWSKIL